MTASGPGEGREAKAEEKGAGGKGPDRTQVRTQQQVRPSPRPDQEYARMKKQIQAYESLKSKGVNERTILRWEKIMALSGLTPGAIQKELTSIGNLSKLEEKTQGRIEKARLALESIRAKNDELKRKYSTSWDSVTRYQLLREAGVDGSVLQRWERLVVGNGLDPVKLEDELLQYRNLNGTRKELEGKLASLDAELGATKKRITAGEGELARLESQRSELLKSVDDVTQYFKNRVQVMTEEATDKLGGVEAKAGEELQRISEEAESNLKAGLTAASTTIDGFKSKIEEAYESAFRIGEAIGRNEALKPLVGFAKTGEGEPGEVIPLMALLAHNLAKWAKESDPALSAEARDLEEYLNGKFR